MRRSSLVPTRGHAPQGRIPALREHLRGLLCTEHTGVQDQCTGEVITTESSKTCTPFWGEARRIFTVLGRARAHALARRPMPAASLRASSCNQPPPGSTPIVSGTIL